MNPVQNMADVMKAQADSGKLYYEFMKIPELSVGFYKLEAGSTDPQNPHLEDEVYYVLNGRSHIQIGEDRHPVVQGDVIFVGKNVYHKFYDIEETLDLLVFFAPAETFPE